MVVTLARSSCAALVTVKDERLSVAPVAPVSVTAPVPAPIESALVSEAWLLVVPVTVKLRSVAVTVALWLRVRLLSILTELVEIVIPPFELSKVTL